MALQLGVNTCTSRAELALFDGSNLIDLLDWEKSNSHSEVITLNFNKLLSKNSFTPLDIDKVYCVNGPGSFTGLRVGVSFSKTIAFSFNLPICSINQLDLQLASTPLGDGSYISVMDAQKNSVFISRFSVMGDAVETIFSNQVLPISEFESIVNSKNKVVGKGLSLYKKFLSSSVLDKLEFCSEETFSLEHIFNSPINAGSIPEQQWFEFQPLYIKASAPEEKLKPTTFQK